MIKGDLKNYFVSIKVGKKLRMKKKKKKNLQAIKANATNYIPIEFPTERKKETNFFKFET